MKRKNVLAIEHRDTSQNIFDRLVFSDENDVIYQEWDFLSGGGLHARTNLESLYIKKEML